MAPAAPTLLPSPPPIADRIALGALTSTFPPGLVDRVIEQTGRAEQRRRLLPARVVVYFVLALALYGQGPMRRCFAAWWRGRAGSAQLAVWHRAGRLGTGRGTRAAGRGAAQGAVRHGRAAAGHLRYRGGDAPMACQVAMAAFRSR